jgi:hypothetical protein
MENLLAGVETMRKGIVLIILLFAALVGCAKEERIEATNQDPQKVVEDYFTYNNEKNREKVASTMSKRLHEQEFDFDNLQGIKLLSIQEDKTEHVRNLYASNDVGKEIKEENIKVYEVSYEVVYEDNMSSPQTSGTYGGKYFFVVREKEGAEWLIDKVSNL